MKKTYITLLTSTLLLGGCASMENMSDEDREMFAAGLKDMSAGFSGQQGHAVDNLQNRRSGLPVQNYYEAPTPTWPRNIYCDTRMYGNRAQTTCH